PTIGITRVYEQESGILVVTLVPGGPADQAGLRGFVRIQRFRRGNEYFEQRTMDPSNADLITAVDGQPVTTADALLGIIETKTPGTSVDLTVLRDGQVREISVRLGQSD
ncbi:MAG: PDZ domain-containing protein, partial [Planctomycetales bacterium]|nr:PDZ domain-containing protein [Planctomycetales bacterium]